MTDITTIAAALRRDDYEQKGIPLHEGIPIEARYERQAEVASRVKEERVKGRLKTALKEDALHIRERALRAVEG